MAIGEAHLAARYNRPGHEIFDHHTYVLASDGDMMEGVQAEAGSLAGHLRLGKLIVLYDTNHVTLSGTASIAFTEDVGARYRAYGWHVQEVDDGNDLAAIARAIVRRETSANRPSLIVGARRCSATARPTSRARSTRTATRSAPTRCRRPSRTSAGPRSRRSTFRTRRLRHFRSALDAGESSTEGWKQRFDAYREAFPELGARDHAPRFAGELPRRMGRQAARSSQPTHKGLRHARRPSRCCSGWRKPCPSWSAARAISIRPRTRGSSRTATSSRPRARSRPCEGAVGGGWGYGGRNIHFGVREHAMGAAVNGLVYHGGFIPFGATFLVFSDYMRPSIRLAAIAQLRSIFVFTHDSIGVGEDGPTHEPIEQLAALRAIPGIVGDPAVRRQRDALGVAAWRIETSRRTDGAGAHAPDTCRRSIARSTRRPKGCSARRLRPPNPRRRPLPTSS